VIRLTVPFTDQDELAEIAAVLKSGYLTQGPKVAEFEQRVAHFVGTRHAFAMSSCTTALHLSLVVLDIRPGDDVLVADFTFPATGNVVVQQGANPILVDVRPDTFTMDPADLERKVTPRSRAIIVVDTFGCAADIDAIQAVAAQHSLPIIEDAACAIGSTYRGRPCGSLTEIGCFSFHPRKVITTGEGGMITTSDERLAERIRLLRSHGGKRNGYKFVYEEAGYNYRLSDVQGAMGIAQMDKLPRLLERRKELARKLRARLSECPNITRPAEPGWGGHIYQSFVVMLDDVLPRDRVVERMAELGVEATLGTYALHAQPFYVRKYGYRPGQLPISYAAYQRALTLPLYPQMSEADVDTVASALCKVTRELVGKETRT
jgi:perosamine synthetase